jgi:hypothetical protein
MVVVSEFILLDGVVRAPGGEPGYTYAGWLMKFPNPQQYKYKLEEVLAHEACL